ncbi:MAG: hypothetical protein MI922_13575 [Bacteroidales bacterium]|nr:hypothetical protein [Bacteroidales bacterium]
MVRPGISIPYISFALLITVFSSIMANTIIYSHVHILENGTVLRHAHPYSKKSNLPGNQHHHSDLELMLIGQLDTFDSPEVTDCPTISNNVMCVIINAGNVNYTFSFLNKGSQRAPPFVFAS